MTDEQWQSFNQAQPMVEYLVRKHLITSRTMRLFAAAVARASWDAIPAGACREAIHTTELCATGNATEEDLNSRYRAVGEAMGEILDLNRFIGEQQLRAPYEIAGSASYRRAEVYQSVSGMHFILANSARLRHELPDAPSKETVDLHCQLLRDLVGPTPNNPPDLQPL